MNALIYYTVYPLLYLVSRLPFALLYSLSDLLCFIIHRLVGYRKEIVRSNIKRALPHYSEAEYKRIEKEFYRHFCDIFLEIIKSMGMTKEEMLTRFQVKNIEVLTQFEKEKRSVFILCGHYASWEWMMSLGYRMKHTGYGIYRPIRNPYFNRLIQRIRSRHNAFMIPQQEAAEIIRTRESINESGVYGFASDQSPHPTPKTYWRTFMGTEVPVYTGAERLARELNIPLVYGEINRVKRGFYEVKFKLLSAQPKTTEVYEITDRYTDWLETQISHDPTQYMWSHRRFKYANL
ncbi:MAG: lysophospholipid acyltransferase family protein [Flavobacteriaceae bacterium]